MSDDTSASASVHSVHNPALAAAASPTTVATDLMDLSTDVALLKSKRAEVLSNIKPVLGPEGFASSTNVTTPIALAVVTKYP